MFPLGFEPRTFRVLGERDNHYTTETDTKRLPQNYISKITGFVQFSNVNIGRK